MHGDGSRKMNNRHPRQTQVFLHVWMPIERETENLENMKKLFALLAVGLVMFTTVMDNAEAARRLGGGSSFGRSAPALRQTTPAPQTPALRQNQNTRQNTAAQQNAAGAAANAAKPSMMRNILMGAAAALGITALLSALGLSEGLGQIIMIVLLAAVLFFAFRMLFGRFAARTAGSRSGAAAQSSYEQASHAQAQNSYSQAQAQPVQERSASAVMPESAGARAGSVMDMFAKQGAQAAQGEAAVGLEIPEGFDVEGFEKVAKANFERLQKAWDTGDYNSLSDFTTDELFIELTHRLRERGSVKQNSEIINLDAKLLGVAKMSDAAEHIAVVEFKGAMKYEGEFEEVDERWVLTRKDDDSSGWLLAGIEQASDK